MHANHEPDLVATLRALTTAVDRLRAELRALRCERRRVSDPVDDAALVPLVVATVGRRAFGARELHEYARHDDTLRAALDNAVLTNPQKVGKWLRRITGRAIAGVAVERVGDDEHGAIWMFREYDSQPYSHPNRRK